jgi:sec-independent protein translocase protein TatA
LRLAASWLRRKERTPHFGVTELLIVLAILLLLFGARKVPELARALGETMKECRKGLRDQTAEGDRNAPTG